MKKNQTILKDELVLFNADKSAVITELRKLRTDLDVAIQEVSDARQEEEEVRGTIKEDMARLDDIRDRAISFSKKLESTKLELTDLRETADKVSVKNKKESKLHLGRIKDLSKKEEELTAKIADLRKVFDRNANVFRESLIEIRNEVKENAKLRDSKSKELDKLTKEIDKAKAEDKKITKDRLKREDKLRVRERLVELKEEGLSKREEDLGAMSSDMNILYGRLKELYAEVKPDLDLDKLITKA